MTDLPQGLLHPAAFGAPSSSSVELRETHISWVFLTERDVYKVKKPKNLGFLDFSTPEQRRRACEAEVELNARFSPGVYHGIVTIGRDARGLLRVGGEGEVVDWAVHMQRLPDERRADHLLESGRLGPSDIERIAEHVAAFHARARTDAAVASYGRQAVVEKNVVENFEQTAGLWAEAIDAATAADIERAQLEFVRSRASLFEARIAANRVRDGHGDLRLEHVYLMPEGDILVLDCIEFNERFRFGDVCADVAFLSMDLGARRRVDLAELLLARYAREANDYDLYALVDFYEGYRAFVRAKIALMMAASPQSTDEARACAVHDARRYGLLAAAATRPPLVPPAVVAVGGVIASGKSTLAEALAREMAAPVVDADRTRKHLLGVEPTHPVRDRPWSGAYDDRFTDRVYRELLRRADVVLGSGRPVIVDASFRTAAHRLAARALARRRGVAFVFLECQVAPDVCRARLRMREAAPAVSDGRLEIFNDFLARFEPVHELAPGEHVVIDTTAPLDEALRTAGQAVALCPHGLLL